MSHYNTTMTITTYLWSLPAVTLKFFWKQKCLACYRNIFSGNLLLWVLKFFMMVFFYAGVSHLLMFFSWIAPRLSPLFMKIIRGLTTALSEHVLRVKTKLSIHRYNFSWLIRNNSLARDQGKTSVLLLRFIINSFYCF